MGNPCLGTLQGYSWAQSRNEGPACHEDWRSGGWRGSVRQWNRVRTGLQRPLANYNLVPRRKQRSSDERPHCTGTFHRTTEQTWQPCHVCVCARACIRWVVLFSVTTGCQAEYFITLSFYSLSMIDCDWIARVIRSCTGYTTVLVYSEHTQVCPHACYSCTCILCSILCHTHPLYTWAIEYDIESKWQN